MIDVLRELAVLVEVHADLGKRLNAADPEHKNSVYNAVHLLLNSNINNITIIGKDIAQIFEATPNTEN